MSWMEHCFGQSNFSGSIHSWALAIGEGGRTRAEFNATRAGLGTDARLGPAPDWGLRRPDRQAALVLPRSAVLGLLLLVACSSSPSQPNPNPTSTTSIDPSVSGPLATNLAALAPDLNGPSALVAQAASMALLAGVQATGTSTTAADVADPPASAGSDRLSRSGTLGVFANVYSFGFQLTVLNSPVGTSPQVFTGDVTFKDPADFVVVAGPPSSTQIPIPPSVGLLVEGGTLAEVTAGSESAQLASTYMAVDCLATLQAKLNAVLSGSGSIVTACSSSPPGVGWFLNTGYIITASVLPDGAPSGFTGVGQEAAGLSQSGVTLTVDCSQTAAATLCAKLSSVAVSVSPPMATVQTSGNQQFTANVTGVSNTNVSWSVAPGGAGGTVNSTTGFYTAPGAAGTDQVVATSLADPLAHGSAMVTVVSGGATGGGSVFVVDSTGYLYSFTDGGTLLTKVQLPGVVGDLNGGEVALANGNVYVTLGASTQTANKIVAYTQAGLAPVTLGSGAFGGLETPRGITYDTNVNEFYVGNGGSTVTVYAANGNAVSVSGSFPGHYGPSGMAFDADDNTIWVANYAGFVGANYGTAEYNENGTANQVFDFSTQFVSPNPHTEPYSIAYCPGTCGFKVWVGFIDDGSGQGTPIIAGYNTDGAAYSATFSVVKPYQLAFDSQTYLWVADKGGLLQYGLGTSDNQAPAGFAAVLTPPIYGVGAL